MTQLLARAFEEAAKLPEGLQDKLAQQLLEDLQSEPKAWPDASSESLEVMADRALAELKAGKTREMGFDEL